MRQGECWVSRRDAGAVIRQGSTVLFEVTECAARILCPNWFVHASCMAGLALKMHARVSLGPLSCFMCEGAALASTCKVASSSPLTVCLICSWQH